jgi:mRNA-degrading endonuclease RelE of RelBE toxin-antitoxin system
MIKYNVKVRQQVKDYLDSLGPEPRHRLNLALKALEAERGDILALREALGGYCRLRVGSHRVIFRYQPGRVIDCVFVEERSLVYQLFEREVLERLQKAD